MLPSRRRARQLRLPPSRSPSRWPQVRTEAGHHAGSGQVSPGQGCQARARTGLQGRPCEAGEVCDPVIRIPCRFEILSKNANQNRSPRQARRDPSGRQGGCGRDLKPSGSTPKAKYKVVDYKTDETTGRPILPQGYKPSADEEYMSKLQQEYFRQRLQRWRNEMVEESKQTIENLREEVRDIGDEAERATRETENSLELRARDRARKLISKIDSTLKRLEDGDYGYCVDTGEEIGLDRLEARLTAERTIDAQERWEHLQKQQGD